MTNDNEHAEFRRIRMLIGDDLTADLDGQSASDIDFRRVVEGECPDGHGALERRDTHGWCETCGIGYSIRPTSITFHMEFTVSPESEYPPDGNGHVVATDSLRDFAK